eukprot:Skav217554  [mRNA]  locus=scaffold1602:188755:189402:+ [translate_table: standard]
MPLISLSAEEQSAALKAASPDLKYHLCEVNVPVEVQAALFHKGFIDLQFTGLDETCLEVRAALAAEIGLKQDESTEARQSVARLLSAWESSRAQLVAEDKMKAESKLGQTPRIAQCSEMAALRQAVEADLGKLQDDEVPAKSLIAAKLEQIESGDLRAEDLHEVLALKTQMWISSAASSSMALAISRSGPAKQALLCQQLRKNCGCAFAALALRG